MEALVSPPAATATGAGTEIKYTDGEPFLEMTAWKGRKEGRMSVSKVHRSTYNFPSKQYVEHDMQRSAVIMTAY